MLSCHIVLDLLPSYLERLTSAETSADIAAHLESCENCRNVYEAMATDIPLEKAPVPSMKFLKNLKRKQVVGAILSLLLTFFCMCSLYNEEFTIDVSSTASLEAGIFGNYRFNKASLGTWPLYHFSPQKLGQEHYIVLYGIYEIPGVSSYAVYPSNDTTAEPYYHGAAETGPFLRIIPVEDAATRTGPGMVHYYDEEGNELIMWELYDEMPYHAEGNLPSVTSAEQWAIYLYLVIILLTGLIFVFFFLIS